MRFNVPPSARSDAKSSCNRPARAEDLSLDPEIEVMATVWVEEHWGVPSWPDGVDPILREVVRNQMASIRRALDRVRQDPFGVIPGAFEPAASFPKEKHPVRGALSHLARGGSSRPELDHNTAGCSRPLRKTPNM
jgi:hypothetical protein